MTGSVILSEQSASFHVANTDTSNSSVERSARKIRITRIACVIIALTASVLIGLGAAYLLPQWVAYVGTALLGTALIGLASVGRCQRNTTPAISDVIDPPLLNGDQQLLCSSQFISTPGLELKDTIHLLEGGKIYSVCPSVNQHLTPIAKKDFNWDSLLGLRKFEFKAFYSGLDFDPPVTSYALITEDGNLHMWGHYGSNRLGVSVNTMRVLKKKFVSQPQEVQGITGKVKKVVAIEDGTYALTDQGTVYVWGSSSGNYPQSPQELDGINGTVRQIESIDRKSCCAVTNQGDLYVWGPVAASTVSSIYGPKPMYTPRKIGGLKGKVKHVKSIGSGVFILTDQKAYICTNLKDLPLQGGGGVQQAGPSFQKVSRIDTSIIKEIIEASDRVFILTTTGLIYAMGNNAQGQLGVGDKTSSPNRRRTRGITNRNIVKIIAAGDQTYALTDKGELYGCGRNIDAQFKKIKGIDGKVDSLETSKDIKLSGALTKGGKLYLWDRFDVNPANLMLPGEKIVKFSFLAGKKNANHFVIVLGSSGKWYAINASGPQKYKHMLLTPKP